VQTLQRHRRVQGSGASGDALRRYASGQCTDGRAAVSVAIRPSQSYRHPPGLGPVTNYHNTRRESVVLMVEEGMIVHGLVGYFESLLYGNVRIYQPALTHTGNIQLVPNFLPLPDPVIVYAAANVQIDF